MSNTTLEEILYQELYQDYNEDRRKYLEEWELLEKDLSEEEDYMSFEEWKKRFFTT